MMGLYQSAMYSAPSGPKRTSTGRKATLLLVMSGVCSTASKPLGASLSSMS